MRFIKNIMLNKLIMICFVLIIAGYSFYFPKDIYANNGHINNVRLRHAAKYGHIDMVKKLLDRGADVNSKDENGRTALSLSLTVEVVDFLIARGADLNAKDIYGRTALMYACINGLNWIVETLLDKGADVHIKSKQGMTALMYASMSDKVGIAFENWSGRLLKGFVNSSTTDIVRMLLKHGANVNERSYSGGTALMDAAAWGHADIVKELIINGAEVNAKNEVGETALTHAKIRKFTKIIHILQANGAK